MIYYCSISGITNYLYIYIIHMSDNKYVDKSLMQKPIQIEKKTIPKIVRPQLIRMDALGRRVKELTDEEKAIGYKTLEQFNLLQHNKLF